MNARAFGSVLLAVLAVALPGCDKPNDAARVHVNYKQVADFYEYLQSPGASGTTGAGQGGMFILYKVTQINNSGGQAKAFTFDAQQVSAVTPDETHNETVVDPSLLANLYLATVSVPAGQTKNVNKCFIKRAKSNDAASIYSTSVHVPLVYASTSEQPVTMHEVAANGPITLAGNPDPNDLQSFCEHA